jgi:hypothetical protein
MDHRNGTRISADVSVELWCGSRKHGEYQTDNIGLGGMFVKHCEDVVSKGDLLTAKINPFGTSTPEQHNLKVVVVHKSDCGAGLMWASYDADFFVGLKDKLAVVS